MKSGECCRYNTLMRSGQTYGQGQFGRLVDKAGTPLLEGGEPYVSNDPGASPPAGPCPAISRYRTSRLRFNPDADK